MDRSSRILSNLMSILLSWRRRLSDEKKCYIKTSDAADQACEQSNANNHCSSHSMRRLVAGVVTTFPSCWLCKEKWREREMTYGNKMNLFLSSFKSIENDRSVRLDYIIAAYLELLHRFVCKCLLHRLRLRRSTHSQNADDIIPTQLSSRQEREC